MSVLQLNGRFEGAAIFENYLQERPWSKC